MKKLLIILFLYVPSSWSYEFTDKLMDSENEPERFSLEKDHFNAHRRLFRFKSRTKINQFVTWCFSKDRIRNANSMFSLNGMEGIFKDCFQELKEIKCSDEDESKTCKFLLSFQDDLIDAKALEKIIPGIEPKKEIKDRKICSKPVVSQAKELSEKCQQDLKKASIPPKGALCTQSFTLMACPSGGVINASDGCISGNLADLGWKRYR